MKTNLKSTLTGLICLFAVSSFAKSSGFLPSGHSEIGLGLNAYMPLKISSSINDRMLKSNIAPCPSLSYRRYIGLNDNSSIGLGVNISSVTTALRFNIPTSANSIYQSGSYKYENIEYQTLQYFGLNFSVPIVYQRNLKLKSGKELIFSIGPKFNFLHYSIDIEGMEVGYAVDTLHVTAFDAFMFTDNDLQIGLYADLRIKAYFKERLNLKLVGEYVPGFWGVGQYSFYHLDKNDFGTISRRLSYVGLEVSYSFKKKKKIKVTSL